MPGHLIDHTVPAQRRTDGTVFVFTKCRTVADMIETSGPYWDETFDICPDCIDAECGPGAYSGIQDRRRREGITPEPWK